MLFPEYFQANKELFFGDLLKAYQDHPERYKMGEGLQLPPEMMGEEGGQPGVGGNLPKTGTQKTGMTPQPGMPNITKSPY
jgi:hypothetical protein